MSDTVGHFVTRYLSLTETFIYQYLTRHNRYDPFVCGVFSENLDLFEFESRELFMELPRWSPRFWIYGALAKFGICDLGNTYYRRVIKRRDPDILHAHFGPEGVRVAPYRTPERKLVTTFYGYDVSRLVKQDDEMRDNYQDLFEQGDLFLVEGPAMQEKLLGLGCPETKTAIQRIAIDTSRISPAYPDPESPLRVLMVGRFVEKKGLPDGIKAFAAAFAGTDAELRIVGGDAEYSREQLETIADVADVREQVTFTGYLDYDDYLAEVHNCSILLTPSKRAPSGDSEGGAPTVLLEAQASGKPVVATTHADIPYVVADGETGLLAQPGNTSELATALRTLASDPSRMSQLGRAGVQRIQNRHDITTLAPALETKYDQLR
jgi:colanic acid/amylovoran biosynthesis glycosyltransferase